MNTADSMTYGKTRPSDSYSGKSPDEIENEIEHTREKLTRTLDALHGRLSPRERLRAVRGSAREIRQRFARAAADSLTPGITAMIRLDHSHVLALFRRFHPWTSAARRNALVTNACLALAVHAQLEEEIFYPALRQLAASSDVLDKSVAEHDEMRILIGTLPTLQVGDPLYEKTFHLLMRIVIHHVADEESVLLPLAEELLGDRLGELGMQMTKRRIELLRPNLREVAVTTARSFPVAAGVVAAGVLALGWLIFGRLARGNSARVRSLAR
jgi:hemerythrin superfamily protein